MNMLEDCTTFHIWAAWILFNFYLQLKQRFSVWSYTENISFISSHERISCRYSETNNPNRSKDLENNKNALKNDGLKDKFKNKGLVCFTGYLLQ